jgi:16S rRNA (guanine527-N7)-methyltransferase
MCGVTTYAHGAMSLPAADGRDEFRAALAVSRETEARLERYEVLLRQANQRLSLIADSTLDQIWTRHFLDSAQLFRFVADPQKTVVDIGSGAGFPGLVLAIMGLPKVHLIEHNMQKAAFLRSVAADLSLPVTVHAMKSQSVRPFPAGAVTARALKPLPVLIGLAHPFIGPQTVCIFPKGRRASEELAEARTRWRMDAESLPSLTDPESTIFRLSHISEARA